MNKWQDKPFALIGIHVGGADVKKVKSVMDQEKLPWRSFVDPGNAGAGPIATQWNLSATPTFYLIDQRGVIRHKWAGPPGDEALHAAVEKLIRRAAEPCEDGSHRQAHHGTAAGFRTQNETPSPPYSVIRSNGSPTNPPKRNRSQQRGFAPL